MKIGNIEIKGKVALAPMAGVTDKTYRKLCGDFGSAFTVTEMVSAKAILHNHKKTGELMDLSQDYRPVGIQIFGDDPFTMAKAAKEAVKENPDFIDINMGCPVPKIAGNNCGSALMKRPDLCGAIVHAMVQAVEVPITVKIRKGWDENSINAVEVAKICEEAGASAVTVHGRTRAQMYQPSADWEIIKAVKDALTIPVIGNGDVVSVQSAYSMLAETGCDMVMIGRAAMGNPWIFKDINAYMNDGCRIMPPPSVYDKIIVIRRHIEAMCKEKGEERGMKEARKHVGWYTHGMPHAAELRKMAGTISTLEDLDILLKQVYLFHMENPMEELSDD